MCKYCNHLYDPQKDFGEELSILKIGTKEKQSLINVATYLDVDKYIGRIPNLITVVSIGEIYGVMKSEVNIQYCPMCGRNFDNDLCSKKILAEMAGLPESASQTSIISKLLFGKEEKK